MWQHWPTAEKTGQNTTDAGSTLHGTDALFQDHAFCTIVNFDADMFRFLTNREITAENSSHERSTMGIRAHIDKKILK